MYVSPLTNALIVSPTVNAPTTLLIPISLGTTSTLPNSSKNVKNLALGLKPLTVYSIFLDLMNGSNSSLAI